MCGNYPTGDSKFTQLEAQGINSSQRKSYPAVRLGRVLKLPVGYFQPNVVCTVPTHGEVFAVFLFRDLLSLKQLGVLIIPDIY